MRRVFGLFAVVVGTSLLWTTSVSAKDPEGRVVNPKTRYPLRKLADPAPAEPTPAEATPTEPTPVEPVPDVVTSTDPGQATEPVGDVVEAAEGTTVRTFEDIQITEDEKRRAAAGKQAAAAEEQQISGRIRGLQALIAREEQLLAQRMAYAAKLREKGLTTNDQATLDQAEKFERAALVEYQKKVQQFERSSVANPAANQLQPQPTRRAPQPPRTSKKPTPPRR